MLCVFATAAFAAPSSGSSGASAEQNTPDTYLYPEQSRRFVDIMRVLGEEEKGLLGYDNDIMPLWYAAHRIVASKTYDESFPGVADAMKLFTAKNGVNAYFFPVFQEQLVQMLTAKLQEYFDQDATYEDKVEVCLYIENYTRLYSGDIDPENVAISELVSLAGSYKLVLKPDSDAFAACLSENADEFVAAISAVTNSSQSTSQQAYEPAARYLLCDTESSKVKAKLPELTRHMEYVNRCSYEPLLFTKALDIIKELDESDRDSLYVFISICYSCADITSKLYGNRYQAELTEFNQYMNSYNAEILPTNTEAEAAMSFAEGIGKRYAVGGGDEE